MAGGWNNASLDAATLPGTAPWDAAARKGATEAGHVDPVERGHTPRSRKMECGHTPFPAGANLSDREAAVLAAADAYFVSRRDRFVSTLARWVAVPSVCESTDGERESAERRDAAGARDATDARDSWAACLQPLGAQVARMFVTASRDCADLGLAPCRHDGYALSVALANGTSSTGLPVGGDDEIGVVCHLDVVPGGDGWSGDPFVLRCGDDASTMRPVSAGSDNIPAGDFLCGRGVHDCKGPSLTMLYVLSAIRDLRVPLRHRVRMIFGGGEEKNMDDIKGYLRHNEAPGFSLVADGPFPVNYGQKGLLQLRVTLPAVGCWRGWQAGDAVNAVPGEASIVLGGVNVGEVRRAIADIYGKDYVHGMARCDGGATGNVVGPHNATGGFDVAGESDGVRITAIGRAGHAAFPQGTVNAIGLLATLLATSQLLQSPGHVDACDGSGVCAGELAIAKVLSSLAAGSDGAVAGIDCSDESGPLTFNVGTVRSTAQTLEIGIDIRYPMTFDGNEIAGRAARTIGGIAAACGCMASVECTMHDPAYAIDPDSAPCRAMQKCFDDYFGVHVPPFTMGGGTHSRLLPKSVTFGPDFWYLDDVAAAVGAPQRLPGIQAGLGGAHEADECISYTNLMTSAKVYLLALMRLDSALD